jgi:putative redox protein
MVRIDVTYRGELRCEAVHGPSGQAVVTDAPVDNQGKGAFFSPTDLVAAALGTCIATIMGIAAQEAGIDLRGLGITVEKEMASEGPRRIGRLTVRIDMPCDLADGDRKTFEAVADLCPVRKSLSPDVETSVAFTYPSRRG